MPRRRARNTFREAAAAQHVFREINRGGKLRRLTATAEKVAGSILAKLQLIKIAKESVFAVFNAHCEKQKQRVVAYIHS